MAEDSWNLFQEEIEEFQVKGLYDEEKSFLPEGCFSRLVTPDRVRVLLPRASESLVLFICSKARKILLTLMCRYSEAQVLSAMKLFQQHNFTDEFLPIEDLEGKCTIRQSGSQKDEKLECTHSVVLNVFHEDWWKPFRFSRFRQDQWTFCAPVFRKNEFKQHLSAGTILPFTSVSKKPKNGHFSKVFEAKLHGDHKDDSEVKNGEDIHVAVKVLEDLPAEKGYNVETAWGQEIDALEKISQLRHKHLIRRIAAFKRGKEYFIVFEWANGGTLRDVWEKHDTENLQLDGDRIMGLLEQLRGLAGALCALHSTNPRTNTAFATRNSMLNSSTYSKPNRNRNVALPSVRGLDNEKAPRITIKVDVPFEEYYDAGGNDDEYDSSDSETSSGDEHWRHGDLKPDNILKFRGATCLGTLKIADLGLAKQHKFKTADRHDPTRQRYSTEQYEAPEVLTNFSQPRSRRYDVWSMGCIIFESVVWLLYGYEGLKAFYREDKHIDKSTETLYFTAFGTPRTAKVSDIVKWWMGQILKDDPECNQATKTALGDLLRLVQNKLLVVALPEPSMKPAEMVNCREGSAKLSDELERIWKDARDKDSYRFTGTSRKGVPRPTPLAGSRSKLSPGMASGAQSSEKIESTIRNLNTYSHAPLNNIWEFLDDNSFARDLFNFQQSEFSSIWPQQNPNLCNRCKHLEFCTSAFVLKDTFADLKISSLTCDFCSLLLTTCTPDQIHLGDSNTLEFSKLGSEIRMKGVNKTVLSICRAPNKLNASSSTEDIRIGLPKLSDINSPRYFKILYQWLEDCNKHTKCAINKPNSSRIPTRLINFSEKDPQKIRLCETVSWEAEKTESLRYIALSHPWGDAKSNNHFCTTSKNVRDRVDNGIIVDSLPDTFKHAVKVTRELGIEYLWIDSLCIIQGDDGDFKDEAQHMESVFSSAYCVIAASRATGTSAGFLGERRDRRFVKFEIPAGNPFYVCEAIDDFQDDVIDGSLNKRGWVLQERALARRTIYFTENQTYWECGEGVRCETLTKMKNDQAAFLGDPHFPNVATKSTKGGQIRLYEYLYKQYSTLQFSKNYDRPIAIAGLEQRLISAFGNQGGYGVFEPYFGRSLLWQRDPAIQGGAMRRIIFPAQQQYQIPTWSWMAYEGGITFLDVPFDGVLWKEDEEGEEIRAPWRRGRHMTSSWHTGDSNGRIDLRCTARNLDLSLIGDEIVYDQVVRPPGRQLKGVVIGRKKSKIVVDVAGLEHYVLVVAPKLEGDVQDVYERVGVGKLLGSCIDLDGPGLKVRVF